MVLAKGGSSVPPGLIGGLAGALLGGALGGFYAQGQCERPECHEAGKGIVVGALAAALLGALIDVAIRYGS